MIGRRLRHIADLLRQRPELALPIADRIAELADRVTIQEAATVPPHLRQTVTPDDGVISLDKHRGRHRTRRA